MQDRYIALIGNNKSVKGKVPLGKEALASLLTPWLARIAAEKEAAARAAREEADRIARAAAEAMQASRGNLEERERAEALVIGTDLDQTGARPEWRDLIARLRRVYRGRLVYAAQGSAGVDKVPFWNKLDAVGVTLFPVLDAEGGPAQWRAALADERNRLLAQARRVKRPLYIAELGFRAEPGATAQTTSGATPPSPAIDEATQAHALAAWLAELSDPAIHTVLIWRWNDAAQDDGFIAKNGKIAQALTKRWHACSRAIVSW